MEFLTGKINAVGKMLSESNLSIDSANSPHELADRIEELLRERWDEL